MSQNLFSWRIGHVLLFSHFKKISLLTFAMSAVTFLIFIFPSAVFGVSFQGLGNLKWFVFTGIHRFSMMINRLILKPLAKG